MRHRYTWAPGRDQLLVDEVFDYQGAIDDTLWAATDHLGTVRQLLDNTEAIVEHRDYTSFGQLEAAFDEFGTATTNLHSSVGYTGKFFDAATGLQYNNARWYDPATGRFLNEDPAQDGSNWYAYAGNDPINFRDPTGLTPAGNPLNNLYSGLGSLGPTYSSQQLFGGAPSLSGPSRTTSPRSSGTLVDLAFPVGPVNTVAQPLTVSQRFAADVIRIGDAATARALGDIAESRRHRTTPSSGIALDYFVDSAFAAAGNLSRGTGNAIGSGIEYATSGYGGRFGNFVAGLGGGAAQLARTAGNIGAVVDLPRTVKGTIADVWEGIQTGREHGFALGVGHFIGTNQIAQGLVGYDFAGQQIDPTGKFAEGFGRLGITALTGAGGARLLYQHKSGPLVSNSFYNVADTGIDLTTYRPTPATFSTGTFSITRQKLATYPSGVAVPQGPFRILDDAEYAAALRTKDIVNNSLRQQYDLRGSGMDIHEIHPVKFNGSPTDLRNKALLDQDYHRQVVTPWWNNLQHEIQRNR